MDPRLKKTGFTPRRSQCSSRSEPRGRNSGQPVGDPLEKSGPSVSAETAPQTTLRFPRAWAWRAPDRTAESIPSLLQEALERNRLRGGLQLVATRRPPAAKAHRPASRVAPRWRRVSTSVQASPCSFLHFSSPTWRDGTCHRNRFCVYILPGGRAPAVGSRRTPPLPERGSTRHGTASGVMPATCKLVSCVGHVSSAATSISPPWRGIRRAPRPL